MDHMDRDVGDVVAAPYPQGEALEFVRFCHRRKRVGWPELYDEMCAVAGRGLYLGYGPEELAAIGIGFGLFQMPALANLVGQVVSEDQERRKAAEGRSEAGPQRARRRGTERGMENPLCGVRPAAIKKGASLGAQTGRPGASPRRLTRRWFRRTQRRRRRESRRPRRGRVRSRPSGPRSLDRSGSRWLPEPERGTRFSRRYRR